MNNSLAFGYEIKEEISEGNNEGNSESLFLITSDKICDTESKINRYALNTNTEKEIGEIKEEIVDDGFIMVGKKGNPVKEKYKPPKAGSTKVDGSVGVGGRVHELGGTIRSR